MSASEEECPVCKEKITNPSQPSPCCGKVFCQRCLSQSFRFRTHCPYCRSTDYVNDSLVLPSRRRHLRPILQGNFDTLNSRRPVGSSIRNLINQLQDAQAQQTSSAAQINLLNQAAPAPAPQNQAPPPFIASARPVAMPRIRVQPPNLITTTQPTNLNAAPAVPVQVPTPAPAPLLPNPAPLLLNQAPLQPNPAPLLLNQAPLRPNPAPLLLNQAPLQPNPAPLLLNQAPLRPNPAPLLLNQAPLRPNHVPLLLNQAPLIPNYTPFLPNPTLPWVNPAPLLLNPAPPQEDLQAVLDDWPWQTEITVMDLNPQPQSSTVRTFVCPYCQDDGLDELDLHDHCNDHHANDFRRVVCPVCVATPHGDPQYYSRDFIGHLNLRHCYYMDDITNLHQSDEMNLQCAILASYRQNI